jgi:hypothetical protein
MILANGCSFTEGYDLQSLDQAWPYCLGRALETPVKNLALGGVSNDRIFRTLKEELTKSQPDTVIVGWTDFSRNELSHRDGMYVRALAGCCLPENEIAPADTDHLHKNWLRFNHNVWINYRNWIYNVLFLQDYLTKSNISFLFFSAFNDNYINQFINETDASLMLADQSYQWRDKSIYAPERSIHREWQELVTLCRHIDLDKWVLRNQETMQSYLRKNNYATDATEHFLEDGHLEWSKVLAKELQ